VKAGYPGMIKERESDAMFAKQVIQRWAEPILIANFEHKAGISAKLFEEGLQPCKKSRGIREIIAIEMGN